MCNISSMQSSITRNIPHVLPHWIMWFVQLPVNPLDASLSFGSIFSNRTSPQCKHNRVFLLACKTEFRTSASLYMKKKLAAILMVKEMSANLWNLDKPSRSMYSSGSLIKLLGCVGKSIRLSFRSSSEFKASAGLIALLIQLELEKIN